MEFQIPLSREDLLHSPGGGVQFTVSERLSAGELVSRLEECRLLMDTSGTDSIVECFPIFFSLLQNFLSVGVSVREGYWRIGVRGLEGVCRKVGGANFTTMTQIKKNELRNALKMMVYLVVQLVEEFETDATKPDSLDIASKKRGGSKKKKKNAAAVTGSDSHSSGMDWGWERERVVDMTSNLMENDLWLLWEPPSVQMMEDFSNLLLSLCYKLLENPAFVREKTGRDKVFGVMGSLMKRFNMGLGVGMKVPQLLQHFEHLVSPLAQAMHCWTQEYGVKTVVPEVVRELGRKDPRDLSQDTSGTRCFAAFLVELSQLVPTAILPSISVLIPHLSGESYTMRNGVLGVIGETVAGALSSTSLDDQSRLTRDKLLDRLEQHIHDVNAFVRSRCLQIWLQLAKAKAIPLPRLKAILPLVFGRTEDKSSNVRKNAVQLLTSVLAANPFAGKLSEEEFKSRLVTEEAKLKALLPSDTCNIDDVTSMVDKEGERGGEGGGEGEGGGGGKEGEREGEKAGEVAKQAAVVKYLRDGIEFIELMSSCVPVCTRLLGSKVNTDVLEALEFLATAYEFQVRGSAEGVKKALALVWSQEQQIRDSIVETYLRLFLRPQSDKPKQIVPLIVQNLISLTMDATHAQLSSLEQMMVLLMKGKHISAPVVKLLWDIFTKSIGNVTQSQSRSAILLLSMIAGADPQIANSNIRVLISHGLNHHGDNPDLVLARHCCVMLQKLDQSHSQTNKPAVPFRFPHSHTMFQEITSLLVSQFSSPASSQWTPFAEQAVATIYRLAEHPDRICGNILRSLVRRMSEREGGGGGGGGGEEKEEGEREGEEREETDTKEIRNFKFSKDVNSLTLSRLIFTAGHVAQWQVIHLETCVARELKRRREAAAEKEEEGERGGGGEGEGKGAKTPSSGPRKTPRKTPGKKTVGGGSSPSLEEEMGLAGAAAEDVEGDMIRRVCEVDVGSTGLLSLFEPLIVSVVANPSKFRCPVLQTSAVLALSKYMMISQHLCEKYLQLLFTVLEKSADTAVRANTIVAAGDLAFRYPNLTEPWTPHLYARKNTIIVLTHLILNDMIKVKGQISEMALVLEDKEESISAKARYFFSQLAKKGNDIYNVLPNIISHLSDPQRQVPREKFRNITRFLFSFVQKDKHCESLVEKICHRFRATGSEQQWRDLAHCLTQINFTDRCVRKLQDNFQCYQDKLVDRDVYTSFTSVTNKAKKFAKPETKALIVELEEMMKAAQQKGLEELEEEREREGVGEGEGGGEGKGGEADEEGSGRKKKQEGDGRNTSVSPPPLPLSRKKAAKTTSKKPSKQVRLLTPAKVATERKKVKVKVNRTSERLKAPLVVSESDEDLDWSDDRDFRTDVLSSARQAVVNSGSLTRRKPVRRARGKKIRQLVFSSDEDEQSEGEREEEEEEEERGEENLTEQHVPPRFTLSDDDI